MHSFPRIRGGLNAFQDQRQSRYALDPRKVVPIESGIDVFSHDSAQPTPFLVVGRDRTTDNGSHVLGGYSLICFAFSRDGCIDRHKDPSDAQIASRTKQGLGLGSLRVDVQLEEEWLPWWCGCDDVGEGIRCVVRYLQMLGPSHEWADSSTLTVWMMPWLPQPLAMASSPSGCANLAMAAGLTKNGAEE